MKTSPEQRPIHIVWNSPIIGAAACPVITRAA